MQNFLRFALCCTALLWIPAALTEGPDAAVSVFAHPDVDPEHLTRDYLRVIFAGRVRSWPDGTPVKVYVLNDSDGVHARFCREVLGTYPYVLRRVWDRLTFTGTGIPPTRVDTLESMRARILETPGAVGYTSAPITPSSSAGALNAALRKGIRP